MRSPLHIVLALLAATVAAQSVPPRNPEAPFSVAVSDENGVGVPSARVFLLTPNSATIRCETDFSGRCQFAALPAGTYELTVEKEGFYILFQTSLQVGPNAGVEVVLHHQQEVREVVDVHESPPAIDPAQVSSQQTLSGLDVLNIPYPSTHDYRNVLAFMPSVVSDSFGQPHVAGAQTYQTLTLLDGFNVTQPANGQLLVRVSTDAFRSITVEPSREPAEYGKASGGVLNLNTGIGDDHFRFAATDFLPSFQNKRGWQFDEWLPRFTFSGPLRQGRMWFYNALDGQYGNLVYTELPRNADNDDVLRIGDLAKVQTNLTTRNILTTSFLLNHLHDNYAFLSPQNPQRTNPSDLETVYVASLKDQHYFAGGELLEAGFAFDQYNLKLAPYGTDPYFLTPEHSGGNYYLRAVTRASRWQALWNLYLPSHEWHGRHDFKFGFDLDRIVYEASFFRRPISYLVEGASLTANETCLNAPPPTPTAPFPCSRYSTFTNRPRHEQRNAEASAYVEDRWLVTERLLVEPGVRFDWDEIVRTPLISPRLAGTYVLDNSGNTKISAGIGLVYDATPIFLIARPFAGDRQDCFFISGVTVNPNCNPSVLSTYVTTTFSADTRSLRAPRFLNWSLGLERKLPVAIYLKAEFMQKRGIRGFVYDTLNGAPSGAFFLENTRADRYDGFEISARHSFRESYMLMGSYTRSHVRSNQALDFNVDSPILSAQQPGPYPWDSPNRFLSWGYLPFFKLPLIKQTEIAYSMDARSGLPFNVTNSQQRLIGAPGFHRFPEYFSLNVQVEKRFHLFRHYWAVRAGFNNITNHRNPYAVNTNVDSPEFLTFSAFQGRAFTSRLRLLGRK